MSNYPKKKGCRQVSAAAEPVSGFYYLITKKDWYSYLPPEFTRT
jgi:hypothetical protein